MAIVKQRVGILTDALTSLREGPMSKKKSRPRRAYLLRCWQEREITVAKASPWRFSLEEILRKEPRQGFDSLGALLAFLQTELTDGSDGSSDSNSCRCHIQRP